MPWFTRGSSADPVIRRARLVDQPVLAALWRRAIEPEHAYLGPERLSQEHTRLTTTYLPACTVWLAQSDRVLGFVALRPDAEIAGLFVDPAAQGRGIGRALLNHVRDRGALHLEVAAPNFTARHFYQRYGFREVSRRHDPDLDEVLLRLKLPHSMQTETAYHG
jgi:ribosomal protein S18 acetylase RimI-like enzyme